jgi:hypothetical protein
VAPLLASHFIVVCPDLRGYGQAFHKFLMVRSYPFGAQASDRTLRQGA